MAHSHEKTCTDCGAIVNIIDMPIAGGVGNKTKEQAYCPQCGTLLYEAMTSGHFDVSVKDESINCKME